MRSRVSASMIKPKPFCVLKNETVPFPGNSGTLSALLGTPTGNSAIKELNNRRFMNCYIKVEETSGAFA